MPCNGFPRRSRASVGLQPPRSVKQEPALRKRVKVVAMASDYASKALREKYGDLVDEYLVLPFAFDQLLAAVTYP